MAKGLTSAYVPLGAVGIRRRIADYFKDKVFYGVLTYNSHPLGCATAQRGDHGRIINVPSVVSVRERTGLSRLKFATLLGVSVRTPGVGARTPGSVRSCSNPTDDRREEPSRTG